ncbi:MAG: hypothetical protein FD119_1409 [Stygiobacter sp.]|nr:MAG: hypothetical protein FD119_1409 [Stygiobacter sp.]
MSTLKHSPAIWLLVMILAGCANSQPVAYRGLDLAPQLGPNSNDDDEHIPFHYAANDADWNRYTEIVLDPVVVYGSPDHQFGELPQEDRVELAAYMGEQFAEALKTKYTLTGTPSPRALRVHLTLTGAEASTPVVSTLTKVTPVTLVINVVQTVRDKPGPFSGTVSYAVELYDSTSNRPLRAYVTKQYPWAENIAASFGTLDASKAGIRNGAELLLAQLADRR